MDWQKLGKSFGLRIYFFSTWVNITLDAQSSPRLVWFGREGGLKETGAKTKRLREKVNTGTFKQAI